VRKTFSLWFKCDEDDKRVQSLFALLKAVNSIINCPDKNLGPSYFMKRQLWPRTHDEQGNLQLYLLGFTYVIWHSFN
jgi:hypothetical protein